MIHLSGCCSMQTDKVSKWVWANLHLGLGEQIFHTVSHEEHTHSCRMEGCGLWATWNKQSITSGDMWTSRVTIRSDAFFHSVYLLSFLLEAPRSCRSWQALCPFKLLCETPRSTSLQVETFVHLIDTQLLSNGSFFFLLSWSLLQISARDCLGHIYTALCTLTESSNNIFLEIQILVRAQLFCQKGCLQLKIISKNQDVLPFWGYYSDWHIFSLLC